VSPNRKAVVIGGGIAGPVAAMALQKAGIEATVHEAHPGTADGVGGMLTLAPNGLAALGLLDLDDEVRRIGLPMTRMLIADGQGRPIGVVPGLAGLPPSVAMFRADLYRCLHDQAQRRGIAIVPGQEFVGADESAAGITARFADGSSADGDVVIGADGTHSVVRTLIDPHAPGPQNVPLLNFGAVADVSIGAEPETTYFVFGRRVFLGYWAQPDGTTAWFSNLPYAEPMTPAQAQHRPAAEWLEVLRAACADDAPGARLLQHTRAEDLVALGSIEIMPSVPQWSRDRLVLIGDAVHAPSPSSGQGASLSIESALLLARCLRDFPDRATAFARYEALRRARVEKVAARAARTNNSKTLGPVAIAMMRWMMPLATRTFLTPERTLGLEQRYRIDW
jgi:2-polyprenyl-6-methoxyphenol hydroxylase-like FAD-dependent oxidoreductase